jgi:DNA-binding PadR family transcriptional regulator
MDTASSSEFSPLSETTLYILVSLTHGPLHGYAIAKEVQALSKNRVILSVSTLYTTLKRLLEDGWIERVGEDPDPEDSGRQRKV